MAQRQASCKLGDVNDDGEVNGNGSRVSARFWDTESGKTTDYGLRLVL